jgi:hypothetical protein
MNTSWMGETKMNPPADKSSDTEQERQRTVQQMIAEEGPNWSDTFKPGSFGCHEFLDRTSLAAEIVECFVLSHPACAQNPNWYALAEQAVARLRELYQRCAGSGPSSGPSPP